MMINAHCRASIDSNHELDRILKSHNLLILKVAEVVKSNQKQVSGTKSVQTKFSRIVARYTDVYRAAWFVFFPGSIAAY